MKRLIVLAAAAIACVLTLHLSFATQVSAQTPIPGGSYRIVIDCDGKYVGATSLTLTLDGSDVVTIPLSLQCSPGGQARQNFSAPSNWNDSKLQYWCDNTKPAATPPPPPLNTLNIPVPPRVELDKWYLLQPCPSDGTTDGPTPAAPGQIRIQFDRNPVGGIAEVAGAETSALGATDSGGSSGTTYAVIAGIVAAAALLGAGGWYARRRWLS